MQCSNQRPEGRIIISLPSPHLSMPFNQILEERLSRVCGHDILYSVISLRDTRLNVETLRAIYGDSCDINVLLKWRC
ncbi:hypothetical protein BDR03DRAFT_947678 [Suillus americanus]|nr:hypothetical protein BDR03DRAFT_947678 [Suillus americanus]